FTALAPVALSAACRRPAASCATAGPISTADVTNNVPSWIFILLLPDSVQIRSQDTAGDHPMPRAEKRILGTSGAFSHAGKTSQGDCCGKAELLSDRGEFCGALRGRGV